MKALTKEKKEKENVLIDWKLISLKNVFLLWFKKIRRKTIKVEREKLMEDKELKESTSPISVVGDGTGIMEEFGSS